MKLNEEKVPVSVTMEQWLIEIMDHTCKTMDINRSQLVTRAVKHYCIDNVIKQNHILLDAVYNHVEKVSN